MKPTVTLSALASVVRRGTDVPAIRGMIREWGSTGRLSERLTGTPCSGWKRCALSTVANTHCAPKLGAERLQPSDWVLDLEDIESDSGKLLARRSALERNSSSSKAAFQTGDVLYGKLRPYLNKVIIADAPGFCTTEIIPIRPGPGLCSRYLHVALTSPSFLRYANRLSYGMKMPRLGTDDLDSAEILVPPLAEQKRIVAKVDELMALCDRLEAQLQERDARSADLAKAALAKFSEEPTVENLEYLFHPSFNVSAQQLQSMLPDLAVKMAHSDPEALEYTLEELLGEESSNGVSKSPSQTSVGVPVLRISAGTSRRDFYVDEHDFKHVELSADEVERHRLRPGDLLACRYNGNLHYVGRFSLYSGSSGAVQVNPDKLIRFRVDTCRFQPRYVCIAMNSRFARRQIESMCATTAGNIGLSASKMKTVRIPVPSEAIQRRIIDTHDALARSCSDLSDLTNTLEQNQQSLLDALVAELAPSN